MVRMAERAVSATPDDVLVSLGLGSCIGLALLDDRAGVAGLAHIVLPTAPTNTASNQLFKFADTAVPALVEEVTRAGASSARLRAVVCGGAAMFGAASNNPVMQIGARNAESTLASLANLRVAVRAQDTGGGSGRSIEVRVSSGEVFVRGVGQQARSL